MPITKGAKKAHRSSEQKRIFNLRRRRAMHEAVKSVRESVSEGDKETATKLLVAAYKAIDKAAKNGVIKDNTASRKKSRLTKLVLANHSK